VSSGPILITGGHGQLGTDLSELLGGTRELEAPGRGELDIADDEAVREVLDRLRPSLVLNCAAFHNVDVCESEERSAFEVNVRAVKRLAEGCAERGAKLVHFSTNYVFDGSAPAPYGEEDPPSPRSVYAVSKLAGEYAALAYGPDSLVIRTAGLYGLHGSASKGGNFVTRALARADEQGSLRMVADQRLSPTFTGDLAAAVIEAVDAGVEGVLHLTSGGSCSWYEFTEAIVSLAGREVEIEQVETQRRDGVADRPLNGVLARARADSLGLTPLRAWREALADYMQRAGLIAASAA
jgi:dTDP-4-dehydrorhamnose reductase